MDPHPVKYSDSGLYIWAGCNHSKCILCCEMVVLSIHHIIRIVALERALYQEKIDEERIEKESLSFYTLVSGINLLM